MCLYSGGFMMLRKLRILGSLVLMATEASATPLPKLFAYNLGTLGGSSCLPRGINEHGQVVGSSSTGPGLATHAFITGARGQEMRDLGTLGGQTSEAYAINNSGRVVGLASVDAGATTRAFVSDPNGGALVALPVPADSPDSVGYGINDVNQIVGYYQVSIDGIAGYQAYIFEVGSSALTNIATLGGLSNSAKSVNSKGQVAGTSQVPSNVYHAFATHAQLTPTDVGAPEAAASFAIDVNDKGQLVISNSYSTNENRASIYSLKSGTSVGIVGLGGKIVEPEGITDDGISFGAATTQPNNRLSLTAFVADKKAKAYAVNDYIVNLPTGVTMRRIVGMSNSKMMAAQGTDNQCYIVCPQKGCGR
jgi:probable HAF family extracellular repeat protein